jgi:hypothetical protein
MLSVPILLLLLPTSRPVRVEAVSQLLGLLVVLEDGRIEIILHIGVLLVHLYPVILVLLGVLLVEKLGVLGVSRHVGAAVHVELGRGLFRLSSYKRIRIF